MKHAIIVRRPRLHLITDDRILADPQFLAHASEILAVLHQRAALHLRAHHTPAADLFRLTDHLRAAHPDAIIIINDRVDIAIAAGANGVQLGARSLPIAAARGLLPTDTLIGYSAHSVDEAVRAEADGANLLLVGTIFRSASHPAAAPAGSDLIARVAGRCRIPILAIGGITTERVAEVRSAGAHGVAVIRAVWDAADPVQAAAELARLVEPKDARM